jgi:hypothetical protein
MIKSSSDGKRDSPKTPESPTSVEAPLVFLPGELIGHQGPRLSTSRIYGDGFKKKKDECYETCHSIWYRNL